MFNKTKQSDMYVKCYAEAFNPIDVTTFFKTLKYIVPVTHLEIIFTHSSWKICSSFFCHLFSMRFQFILFFVTVELSGICF